MIRYNDDLVEDVRNANDIVDIISQYVTLKRNGRNFIGLCPFHKEKTPSFCVSPEKQIFHCFGCGVGGNVFNFITRIENVDYRTSIEMLAEKAGITLPVTDSGEDLKKQQLREKVYEINEKIAQVYHENLYTPNAKPGQEYVKKRKLDNATLKKFKIGYASAGKSIFELLKNEGYTDEQILASALVRKKDGKFIDVFKNRLIFPIFDVRGRVIAFGGRVLDNSLPKYINSPDTVVYSKGRNLYGLNIAKSNSAEEIIIVEGYMDCISLHQRGISNAVASLGTALTEAQGRLLRKYTKKIIISYDSDGAGQAATLRGLDILSNLGADVRILQMEGAKDPDEFVIKYGNARFNLLVQKAISLTEFKAKMLKKDLNLENVNDKIKFLKEIAKLLGNVESKIEQEVYIDKIAKEYKITKEAIYAEINKNNSKAVSEKILNRPKPINTTHQKENISLAILKRENTIISMLSSGEIEVYKRLKDIVLPEDFQSEVNRNIVQKIYNEFEKKMQNIDILSLFSEDENFNRLTEILAGDYSIENDKKAIENIINIYEKEKLLNRKNEIIKEIATSNKDNVKELEKELQEIIEKLSQKKV